MQSTLFTELTISQEASLSGGTKKKDKDEHKKSKSFKIVIKDVYAGDGGDGGSVSIDL